MKLNTVLISDCLTNCDSHCVRSFENSSLNDDAPGIVYGRGIINGMVTALMATGYSFDDALFVVYQNVHDTSPHGAFDKRCVPPAWLDTWNELWKSNR
jgi:hypothetical protein